jgi:hypothetical protein
MTNEKIGAFFVHSGALGQTRGALSFVLIGVLSSACGAGSDGSEFDDVVQDVADVDDGSVVHYPAAGSPDPDTGAARGELADEAETPVLVETGELATLPLALLSDCPPNVMCTWEHANGLGARFDLRTEDSTFHNNACNGCSNGNTWGDQMSSFRNNTNRLYCYYQDIDFRGASLGVIAPGAEGNFVPSHNDLFSSARPCP